MFNKLINNKKQFNYIFKMLLIVTFFIAIEVLTGAKSMREVDSTTEAIIYQNLIQEDKNNKMELKNFGAITDCEYSSIRNRQSDKLYKDLTLEERIIHNYILSYNDKNTVESRESLQKELNSKYNEFKDKTKRKYSSFKTTITTILMFIYLGILIYMGLDAILEIKIETFVFGVIYAVLFANAMNGFLPDSKFILIGLIILDIFFMLSKFLYTKPFLKKYEIVNEFEKSL